MRWTIFVLFVMASLASHDAYAQNKQGRAEAASRFGGGIAGDDTHLFIGESSSASGPGHVHHYVVGNAIDEWELLESIEAPDEREGRRFGHSVAYSEGRLVVGAPSDAGNGAVYVFSIDSSTNKMIFDQRLQIVGEVGDSFADVVAVQGDIVVAGARTANNRDGAVHIFRMDNAGKFVLEGSFPGRTGGRGEYGASVAMSDGTVVVGGPYTFRRSGLVHTYSLLPDGTWSTPSALSLPQGSTPGQFGISVAISGNTILVGGNGYDARGAVLEYRWNSVLKYWEYKGIVAMGQFNDNFGFSLAYAPPLMAVGSIGHDSGLGRIQMFRHDGTWWNQELSSIGTINAPALGRVVHVSGRAVAGASLEAGYFDGIVRLYVDNSANGNWVEVDMLESPLEGFQPVTGEVQYCENGFAAGFECHEVDLLSHLPPDAVGGAGRLNDVWGWHDPQSGREFALLGRNDGTAFVEVTDPVNPVFRAFLPTHSTLSATRDIKVLDGYAYIVADLAQNHGIQIVDLRRLLDNTVSGEIAADAHYDGITSAHNIAINTDSGRGYVTGDLSQTGCSGGLHMIDLAVPLRPTSIGCARDSMTGNNDPGYTHDVQCVTYGGPDARFLGREICIASNETHVSVLDVTNPAVPSVLGRGTYPAVGYVHQGWFSDDQRYFFQNDEFDEYEQSARTKTMIWDMEDLTDPVVAVIFEAETASVDHNLYISGTTMVQANYGSGVRFLDVTNPLQPVETGYLDTSPADFGGAWTAYPYLPSGVVLVSSISEGLFMVRPSDWQPTHVVPEAAPRAFALSVYPNPVVDDAWLTVSLQEAGTLDVDVFDVLGRNVWSRSAIPVVGGENMIQVPFAAVPAGSYVIRVGHTHGTMSRLVVRASR